MPGPAARFKPGISLEPAAVLQFSLFQVLIATRGDETEMTKGHMEAFSDGVFAVIITIMVLELRSPQGTSPAAVKPLIPVFLCPELHLCGNLLEQSPSPSPGSAICLKSTGIAAQNPSSPGPASRISRVSGGKAALWGSDSSLRALIDSCKRKVLEAISEKETLLGRVERESKGALRISKLYGQGRRSITWPLPLGGQRLLLIDEVTARPVSRLGLASRSLRAYTDQCSWRRYAINALRSSGFKSTGVIPPSVILLSGAWSSAANCASVNFWPIPVRAPAAAVPTPPSP